MSEELMFPSYKDLPEHFFKDANAWHRVVSLIFFNGPTCEELEHDFVFKPKHPDTFLRDYRIFFDHLNNRRYEHNYKMAGCAYMFSQFMTMVSYPDHLWLEPPQRKAMSHSDLVAAMQRGESVDQPY